MKDPGIVAWAALATVVLGGVLVDLVAHRGERGLGRRAAVSWSIFWIALATVFGAWIAYAFGREAAEDYFTAFLVEKSLSIDNLFVFLVVFERLAIPEKHQHRVLVWGILGAFVTRAIFVASGSAILAAWHGVVYPLGAFLVFTGIKTALERGGEKEPKLLGFVRRKLPSASPLLLAGIAIELTDIVFAVDSLPAVFAITEVPFLVYASNVFAILGLRALYLVLADLLSDLQYMRHGLAAILVFAGLKMLTSSLFHVPHVVSLATIALVVGGAVLASVIARRRRRARGA